MSWWYGRGWVGQWRRNGDMLLRTLEFFSVGQLLSTLFSPFRQISAGVGGDGSLPAAVSAFFDKLVSRIIGALIRSTTILVGVVLIALQAAYVGVSMVLWWVVPLFPLAGLVLFMLGWVPNV